LGGRSRRILLQDWIYTKTQDLTWKITETEKDWGCVAQVVECLTSKAEALSSKPLSWKKPVQIVMAAVCRTESSRNCGAAVRRLSDAKE
jgi:hypothetical protein